MNVCGIPLLRLFALIVGFGIAELKAQAGGADYASVIQSNFPAWAPSGILTGQAVDRLLTSPGLTPQQSAAVAAMKCGHKDKSTSFSYSEPQLLNDSLVRTRYSELLKSIQSSCTPSLFAKGRPHFSKLQQGPFGDCFFFCVTGAIVHRNPQTIAVMITPLPQGYRVRFGNGAAFVVPQPTIAECFAYNSPSTASDGVWVTVLQKAVAQWRKTHQQAPVSDDPESLDWMNGGLAFQMVSLYTGHRHKRFRIPTRLESPEANALRNQLAEAIAQKRLMTMGLVGFKGEAGANPPGKKDASIVVTHHAYAILGYDRALGLLTVWNPWGIDKQPIHPDLPESIRNGYSTHHGVFKIPLRTLITQTRGTISVEMP